MTNEELRILQERYDRGECTPEEIALINRAQDELLARQTPPSVDQLTRLEARFLNHMQERDMGLSQRNRPRIYIWLSAAASVLLIAGAAIFLFNGKGNDASNQPQQALVIDDVMPGSNKAILTTAGKKIDLTSAAAGQIAAVPGLVKSGDGEIIYDNGGTQAVTSTITVPRGGQFSVTLSDGTKVKLNAASSMTFPSHFSGKYREVSLKGEAYFEVAKNKDLPFIVKTDLQTIDVLGTHFNVNAYPDEPATVTTLKEGSVRVTSGSSGEVLKPGQQSLNRDGKLSVRTANVQNALAWTNNKIDFESSDVRSIMRQLSRWYDVDVVYEGSNFDRRLAAGINRDWNLSMVLHGLELYGLKFKLIKTGNRTSLIVRDN